MMSWQRMLSTLLALSLPTVLLAQEPIGTIKSLRGQVNLERTGQQRPARLGESLSEQDRLRTGADGYLGIGLRDQSAISLGPNADMALTRYRFDSTTHQGAHDVQVRSGSLAAISGKIAKANPSSVQFNTGTVTLGVRGTQFIMEVQPQSEGNASYWTDSQQQVVRSAAGECWRRGDGLTNSHSDCKPDRYVLMPDRDGVVGRIELQARASTGDRRLTLERAYESAEWGVLDVRTRTLQPAELQARYQGLLDALPPSPRIFIVRFAPGQSAQLSSESLNVLDQVREALRRWPVVPNVDVVGHTDTSGAAAQNDALSLARARAVAGWLNTDSVLIPQDRLHVSGRGERQLLVPTPDDTPEPANRRVEITVY